MFLADLCWSLAQLYILPIELDRVRIYSYECPQGLILQTAEERVALLGAST